MPIKGTCVATFNNAVPIGMHGKWNIDMGIPVFRSYGQGNGTPGSGYNGSDLGTKTDVSGSFEFVVESSGQNLRQIISQGTYGFFTVDWPLGDPALGATKAKAIDCHFDRISFGVNNPDGSFIITGSMSAGTVTGEVFAPATV
jgi:hypothetical protein